MYDNLEKLLEDPRWSSAKLRIICTSNQHYNIYVLVNGSNIIVSGTGYTTLSAALSFAEKAAVDYLKLMEGK